MTQVVSSEIIPDDILEKLFKSRKSRFITRESTKEFIINTIRHNYPNIKKSDIECVVQARYKNMMKAHRNTYTKSSETGLVTTVEEFRKNERRRLVRERRYQRRA